ncbi:MAG: L7Ae/L30e/S12e/Gadd45 family ribosomal protein [Acetivibrionales bacterium]|jgi:ribosomal protein L7Ae-like RNA K-turn-binding protein
MESKLYSFIGLAKKSGNLVSGEDACRRAIKSGKVFLVVVAEDASENTKKEFTNACRYRGIDICLFGKKELLGRHIGKSVRAVVGILDRGFAESLKQKIFRHNKEHGGGQIGQS